MKRLLLTAAVAAASLCIAGPAAAVVYVEGTGEPAFTNTTTNTQWMKWQGAAAYDQYRIEADYYMDGALKKHEEGGLVDPKGSGVFKLGWTQMQQGSTYTICSYGRYWIGGFGSTDTSSCSHAIDTGKRASTTIDLTKPAIAVKIDNGAPYSRTAKLNYHIDYSDNLAFPFPANFVCRDIGTNPAQACATVTHEYNEACSVPLGGMKKVTYFNCNEDLTPHNVPDGPITFCVVSADSAIPDNPNNANQGSTADKANLSDRTCDSITLDRTPPQVSLTASATTVQTGDLVTFGVQASDATSGVSGQYAWKWGDNTQDGSGGAPTHSFTTAGTYEVKVTTADAAGNEAVATKVITVNPRGTGTGTGTGTGSGTGGKTPTGSGTGTGTGTGSGTGTGTATGGSGTVTPAPAVKELAASAGGGGTQETAVGGLEVLAPKRVKLTAKTRSLSIALTGETPGKASIALVRGGKVHTQGTVVLATAGTLGFKLGLPKNLKPGAYQMKISFTPAGQSKASTKTVKLTFVKGKAARAKKSSLLARSSSVREPAPRGFEVSPVGAPSGVPTGKAPAAPKSRRVELPVE